MDFAVIEDLRGGRKVLVMSYYRSYGPLRQCQVYYIRCPRLRAQSIQSTAYFSRFLWGNWVGDPVLQECDLRSCWQCKLIYDRPLVACSFVMLFVLSTHALWPFSFALPETTDRFINKVLFASFFRHALGGLMEYARQFFYLRTIFILFAHRYGEFVFICFVLLEIKILFPLFISLRLIILVTFSGIYFVGMPVTLNTGNIFIGLTSY